MKSNTPPIGFKLLSIQTEQFALFEENFKDSSNLNFEMSIEFKVYKEDMRLGCFPSFIFNLKKKPLIKLEISCTFLILEKHWIEFTTDGELKIPKGFAQHITALTISTARGILHAKTEGTPFNKYYLPLINVQKLIEDDIIFKLSEKEID